MQLFIDSADIDEISEAVSWGIIDGVTTNPTLATKTGKPFSEIVREIFRIVSGPVSLEVISTSANEMIEEGIKLARLNKNVVVKLPCTIDGLKALKALKSKKIKVNMTLVFSANQALLAAKLGADYVSPFTGRVDDIFESAGDELVSEIIQVFKNYSFKTKILDASIRDTEHVKRAALAGVDVVTAPFKVISELVRHPLTDQGLAKFLEDWQKSAQKPLV